MSDTAFLVAITSFDPARKIESIKRIREVTGVGIAEGKAMIESTPSVIMGGLYRSQAEDLSRLLEETGMTVEIRKDKSNEPSLKNLSQINFNPGGKDSVATKRFVYEFQDVGYLSIYGECPDDAYISFEVIDGNNIWLSANRAGWLHLARICCEFGMQSNFEPGYHVHLSTEVAFALSSDIT